MTDRYNGWTNYETWNVHLWLNNEEGTQRAWESNAFRCWEESEGEKSNILTRSEIARRHLGEMLKESVEEHPLIDSPSMYCDILTCAFGRVNWDEIANAFMTTVSEYEPAADQEE